MRGEVVAFDYPAKSGQRRRQRVIDREAAEAVGRMLRRRGGGDELIALAVSGEAAAGSKARRKRAMVRAVEEVAHHLGNTPAVCRASYIDPRVFDRFDGGLTIGGVLPDLAADAEDWPSVQRTVEEGVLDLIAADESSPAIERAA